jgi:signal transduction histidine kinase
MADWYQPERRSAPTVEEALALIERQLESMAEKVEEAVNLARHADSTAGNNGELLTTHIKESADLASILPDLINMTAERRSVYLFWRFILAIGAVAAAIVGIWTLVEKVRP